MAAETPTISHLIEARDAARDLYFSHLDPGNLKPAQRRAFQYRNTALLLLLKAAQMELDAELEIHTLLARTAA